MRRVKRLGPFELCRIGYSPEKVERRNYYLWKCHQIDIWEKEETQDIFGVRMMVMKCLEALCKENATSESVGKVRVVLSRKGD